MHIGLRRQYITERASNRDNASKVKGVTCASLHVLATVSPSVSLRHSVEHVWSAREA